MPYDRRLGRHESVEISRTSHWEEKPFDSIEGVTIERSELKFDRAICDNLRTRDQLQTLKYFFPSACDVRLVYRRDLRKEMIDLIK